jgi:hypothetical protein
MRRSATAVRRWVNGEHPAELDGDLPRGDWDVL